MRKIEYLNYVLRSRDTSRGGRLVKVTFSDDSYGVADFHFWPELGDPPDSWDVFRKFLSTAFEDSSNSLATPPPAFPVFAYNCYLNLLDDAANRRQGLPQIRKRIKNHYLLPSLTDQHSSPILDCIREGFLTFKIKLAPSQSAPFLESFKRLLPPLLDYRIKLRLDFNEKWTLSECSQVLEKLSYGQFSCIEFVEDPVPYNPREWASIKSRFPLKLAIDAAATRAQFREHSLSEESVDWIVLKPSRDPMSLWSSALESLPYRATMTSNLGHSVGILSDLQYADGILERDPEAVFGFASHLFYAPHCVPIPMEGANIVPHPEFQTGLEAWYLEQDWKNLF